MINPELEFVVITVINITIGAFTVEIKIIADVKRTIRFTGNVDRNLGQLGARLLVFYRYFISAAVEKPELPGVYFAYIQAEHA